MKMRIMRFIILSAIGFALGGGFALYQSARSAHVVKPEEKVATASKTVSTPEPMAGVSVGGAFSLIDHTGKAVTEKSWPGKYKLVFFGFTSCPDTCPATLQKITSVMEHVDSKGEKIAPLFISVDPEVDTPEVMARYVEAYNPHIVGLTGTQEQVSAAEDAYKVFASKGAGKAAPVDHSAYIYLMSPDDRLLQTFSVEDPAEKIIGKIQESVK